MAFELPPKSQVGYLDPEIAGEGQKVITSEGDQISWSPPPPMPVMPDWSQNKAIRKYFNRTVDVSPNKVWPHWLYHPTEPDRLVKSAEEAAELGVCYRKTTVDEGSQFGRQYTFDWKRGAEDLMWRPTTWHPPKFDPHNPGTGKHVLFAAAQAPTAQAMMIEMLPQLAASVAAAVAQALKAHGDAPASSIDPSKIAEKAVVEVAANALTSEDAPGEDEELEIWRAEAERKGIKVDKRWKIGRLKAEIDKAA